MLHIQDQNERIINDQGPKGLAPKGSAGHPIPSRRQLKDERIQIRTSRRARKGQRKIQEVERNTSDRV